MVNCWNSWAYKKIVSGFKDKVVSLFKINTPKQTVHGRGHKLSKKKTTWWTEKQSDENITSWM